jgi:hypothetical protein
VAKGRDSRVGAVVGTGPGVTVERRRPPGATSAGIAVAVGAEVFVWLGTVTGTSVSVAVGVVVTVDGAVGSTQRAQATSSAGHTKSIHLKVAPLLLTPPDLPFLPSCPPVYHGFSFEA